MIGRSFFTAFAYRSAKRCHSFSSLGHQLLRGSVGAAYSGMQPRILLSSINSDECGRGEIAHSFGGSMVLGEEQHITRSPAACAKIGQNPSAVSGIRRGPSGDLRRELVWMLGKPPRLTALLAQLLSTRRRDGVRVNPLRKNGGAGMRRNLDSSDSSEVAASMHGPGSSQQSRWAGEAGARTCCPLYRCVH
jgi:hypothetical protein